MSCNLITNEDIQITNMAETKLDGIIEILKNIKSSNTNKSLHN